MRFNGTKFNQIVEAAKAKASGNARWVTAIERAAAGLRGGWIVTEHIDHLMITTEGGTYRVNGHCDCEAAKHGDQICKHRAAKRLYLLMQDAEAATPAASLVLNTYAGRREHVVELTGKETRAKVEVKFTESFPLPGGRLAVAGETALVPKTAVKLPYCGDKQLQHLAMLPPFEQRQAEREKAVLSKREGNAVRFPDSPILV